VIVVMDSSVVLHMKQTMVQRIMIKTLQRADLIQDNEVDRISSLLV